MSLYLVYLVVVFLPLYIAQEKERTPAPHAFLMTVWRSQAKRERELKPLTVLEAVALVHGVNPWRFKLSLNLCQQAVASLPFMVV